MQQSQLQHWARGSAAGRGADKAIARRSICIAPRAGSNGNGADTPSFANANFPSTPDGRTYHLGTKKGEVANRILTVGSNERAKMLAQLLQPHTPDRPMVQKLSSRGFMTITGDYEGVPVSIISHLMGVSNMDFTVRECRAVVDGPMAIVRLGTCGVVQPPAKLGQLVVAWPGSICVRRNPDAWTLGNGTSAYTTTLPVHADEELTKFLMAEAAEALGHEAVTSGLNATADSFYSSQGRQGGDFDDRNSQLISDLCAQHPELTSLEMETFQLLDLARCSGGTIRAAGMCIALAERYSNRFLDYKQLTTLEIQGGKVALKALTKLSMPDQNGSFDGGIISMDVSDMSVSDPMSTIDYFRTI